MPMSLRQIGTKAKKIASNCSDVEVKEFKVVADLARYVRVHID
jgi:hypothetical protein